jgi:hypothetical protein
VRLLFVHGIAQGGRKRDDIKAEWLGALRKGLSKSNLELPANVTVDLPFYGDTLLDFVRGSDAPDSAGIVAKGGEIPDDYAAFRDRVTEEMRANSGISNAEVQAEMGPGVTERGVQNWKWVQAIVRIIDRRTPGISGWTIEEFLREVFVYTNRTSARNKINEIVSGELKDDTAVVVGHSLGSVVVYNILRDRGAKVPLLVTVGSPLAIRAIRSTLGPLKNPSGVKGWYNALDPTDVVALYPLDSENFNVKPAIANNTKVVNWTENRHGIVGYLDDAAVAASIRSGL